MGWIPARSADVSPTVSQIVVHRALAHDRGLSGTASSRSRQRWRSGRPGWRRRSGTSTSPPVRALSGSLPRRLRSRDERLLEADRVARRRRRRHPRHEHAAASRAGRVARVRARVEYDGGGTAEARTARRADLDYGVKDARLRRAMSPSAATNEPLSVFCCDPRRRARDRVAAGEGLPVAARRVRDRDLVEAVEEAVAAAAGAAVPALGRDDRRPACRGCAGSRIGCDAGDAVDPHAPLVRALGISSTATRAGLPTGRFAAIW